MDSKRKGRIAVPKTKTFTGCWTCRARKVKCDGQRPTCHRCRKGGHTCEGFDAKLYWVTDHYGVAPSAIKRQAMSILDDESAQKWKFDSQELDSCIAYIEERAESLVGHDQTISTGPFSVFLPMRASKVSHLRPSEDHSTERLNEDDGSELDYVNQRKLQHYFTDQDTSRVDGAQFIASPTPSTSSSASSSSSSSSNLQLLPALNPSMFRDSLTDMLVNNYVFEVANILTPVSHPKSHYAVIYVPKALDGAAAVMSGMDLMIPTSEATPSNIATFYTLLATSAFHLFSSSGASNLGVRFDVVAEGFRGKAMKYLQKALQNTIQDNEKKVITHQSRSSATQSEAIISAMMSLITMDVMEGSMSEFQIHLSGIVRVAAQMRKSAPLSPQTMRLLTICSFLTTISNTTCLDKDSLPYPDVSIDHTPSTGEVTVNPDYTLEFTYGITPKLLSLMRTVVELSQSISYHTTRATALPHSLQNFCIETLEALSQWSIEDEPLASRFSALHIDPTLRITRHHVIAFSYGLRVYYHTRVMSCTPQEMTDLVGRTAYHLTCIEKIKQDADFDTKIGTSISWPGFIASCEAEKGPARDVWYRWWRGMASSPIGNISRLWLIVQDAWRVRDEGSLEVPAWMPVLRRTGQQIIAI